MTSRNKPEPTLPGDDPGHAPEEVTLDPSPEEVTLDPGPVEDNPDQVIEFDLLEKPEHRPSWPGRDPADFAKAVEKLTDVERPPVCPHCQSDLLAHSGANPHTVGAMHCNTCGCCFVDGELRPGTLACKIADGVGSPLV